VLLSYRVYVFSILCTVGMIDDISVDNFCNGML